MIYTTTLTQKGQVTIPVDIRRFLRLVPYEKVTFIKEADRVVIKSTRSFLDMRGSVKSRKKYQDHAADRAVLSYIKKQHGK